MLPPFDPWLCGAVAADVAAAWHTPADALQQRQQRRLAALFAAARRSRFYAPRLKGDAQALRLADQPPVRKADLMAAFGDWVTDPALQLPALRRFLGDPSRIAEPFLGRYTVWESSGSSGEPGVFVQDPAAMAVYDALEALRRSPLRPLQRMLDPWMAGERLVFVGATSGHFASTVSLERLRRLNPVLGPRLLSVSFLQPLQALVDALRAARPTVLATYPSAARVLAQEQAEGRLDIAPQEVWTGGETLSPAARRFISHAFGCGVSESYGASEFLAIAFQCAQGHLHCNSDWLILEPVDEQGRPVPHGVEGAHVLLTNLANHVQPLIRYELDDRVTLQAARCACGSSFPVLQVLGRSDDTLLLRPPGARPVRLLPLALSTVLEDEAGLFDFQLVQEGPHRLLLRTGLHGVEATHALARARATLERYLALQGAAGVQVRCRSGQLLRPGRSGKLKRVVAWTAAAQAASASAGPSPQGAGTECTMRLNSGL